MPQLSPLTSHFSPPSLAALPYNPALSLWLSVDPLSDKYPNLSPYVYCANNPVRLVDKDGREWGDFWDMNGKYLGTDGIDDGKVYVVTDRNAISYSYSYDREKYAGVFTINQENIDDIHRVPASTTDRAYIVDNLEQFDSHHPNAEWGGLCGDVLDNTSKHFGTEQVVWGIPGTAGDPCAEGAIKSYRQTQDYGYNGYAAFFDFHSHGSGTCEGVPAWEQEPGTTDRNNTYQRQQQTHHRSFAVFAMSDKSVHFYNGTRNCGSMPFEIFIKISR